jgi:transcriptional regulator with XRE-family HTH domain
MIDIDRLLKDRKLSKTDIAKKMGLSRESLYRILSGNPTLENIQKLAGAIGVPISDLFEQPIENTLTCPNCGAKFRMEG